MAEHTITVKGDDLQYTRSTLLDIYGKTSHHHTAENTLRRGY